MWKNRRVLIAGGRGFIGSNLVERLVNRGAIVTITQKDLLIFSEMMKLNIYKENGYSVIPVDLLRKNDCEFITKDQDIVFMCAAVTHGAAFMKENPLALVTSNIIMNSQMLDASYKNDVKKFVFISSSSAYPDTKEIPTKEEDMNIGDPTDCYYPVGWMKRYSEILCKTYAEKIKKTMQCIVIRPSNIFGSNDDYNFETSHVTASLIRKVAEHHDPIEIWGDGNDIRDILYINDFIDGMLIATEKLDKYDPINIGYGKAFSVKEILNMLLEIENYNPKIIFNKDKPSMIPIRKIDISKAEKLLNFKPKIDIKDGLKKTIKWYKENYL